MKFSNRAGTWGWEHPERFCTRLWDVENDPQQTRPVEDAAVEKKMIEHLSRLMKECDAPAEQWERLGLTE